MSENETTEAKTAEVSSGSESDPEANDNNGGNEAKTDNGSRKHGRSFIYLALADAETAARMIDEQARRMPMKSFAHALGHPEPVGRFKHKLAALDSYDLVKSEGEQVRLTDLAIEMLYGPTEQVRLRARAKAFLSYDLFRETFVQCPKNQDQKMSYVDDFVRVTLKIVNERDSFLKRFLESAAYAGLLEGEANPKAPTIRLRPALAAPTNGQSGPDEKAKTPEDQWVIVAPNDIVSLLDNLGLTAFQSRCDVSQRSAGEVAITMADGRISVEVRRPVRVAIKTESMLEDVTVILKSLQSKGFKT